MPAGAFGDSAVAVGTDGTAGVAGAVAMGCGASTGESVPVGSAAGGGAAIETAVALGAGWATGVGIRVPCGRRLAFAYRPIASRTARNTNTPVATTGSGKRTYADGSRS